MGKGVNRQLKIDLQRSAPLDWQFNGKFKLLLRKGIITYLIKGNYSP